MKLATDEDVQHPFTRQAYTALFTFGSLLTSWLALRERVSVGELLDAILDQVNYRAWLEDGTEEAKSAGPISWSFAARPASTAS